MYWALGLAVLLLVALVAHWIGLWAERRGWIYWRKRSRTYGGGATGAFGEIQTLLSPSYRHTAEEVQAKKALRVDHTTGHKHRIAVDLDDNVVRMPVTGNGAGCRRSDGRHL